MIFMLKKPKQTRSFRKKPLSHTQELFGEICLFLEQVVQLFEEVPKQV